MNVSRCCGSAASYLEAKNIIGECSLALINEVETYQEYVNHYMYKGYLSKERTVSENVQVWLATSGDYYVQKI